MEYLTEEECAQVQQLGIVADALINKSVLSSACFDVSASCFDVL